MRFISRPAPVNKRTHTTHNGEVPLAVTGKKGWPLAAAAEKAPNYRGHRPATSLGRHDSYGRSGGLVFANSDVPVALKVVIAAVIATHQ